MATTEQRKAYAREYARKWRIENPRQTQNTELKRHHRMTLDDYEAVLDEQGGGCAICGSKPGEVGTGGATKGTLAVDHCHETDTFRGLLCTNCNLGLGSFKDNLVLLANAIAYLQQHQQLVSQLLLQKGLVGLVQADLANDCLDELKDLK